LIWSSWILTDRSRSPDSEAETEVHRVLKVIPGGDGLVRRDDGKTGFVPFVLPDELVRLRVLREKKNFFRAEPVEILEPAEERVEPVCPYFGRCGGCAYQHMPYERQLELKQQQVEETLRRIGKLEEVPLHPIIGSPRQYGYRTRISVHHQNGRLGFHWFDNRAVLDIEHCPLAEDSVNTKLNGLRARLQRRGTVRERLTLRADSAEAGFSQVNEAARPLLVEEIRRIMPDSGTDLIDAYCGHGLYSFALAERFHRVTGIEWDSRSTTAAIKTAQSNPLSGNRDLRFLQGDVAEHLPTELARLRETPDAHAAIIVNPPREGLSEPVRENLVTDALPDAVHTLCYVSCNPATLARDLRHILSLNPNTNPNRGSDFQLTSVTPVDMFPQTAEVETVVTLRRT
jgi:tRNA/tmRNA/rRNA uracil-C5-methylase (TrmA/RlmC/RlmD family)